MGFALEPVAGKCHTLGMAVGLIGQAAGGCGGTTASMQPVAENQYEPELFVKEPVREPKPH